MDLILHLNIYIFPMILLACIYMSMQRNSIQTTGNRMFERVLFCTFLLLLSDLLSWVFNGTDFLLPRLLVWLLNIIYFAATPLVSLAWLAYIGYFIFKRTMRKYPCSVKLLLFVPLAINYILLILTPFTGMIFTLNAQNEYVRGYLYLFPYFINLFYMLCAIGEELYEIFTEKNATKRNSHVFYCVMTLIVLSTSLFQATFENMWIVYPTTAIMELLTYSYTQKKHITTDSLTGVYNRGCFDNYLQQQFDKKDARDSLCLFMLDLDHFKTINDTFGHDIGDDALIRTAMLLEDHFHGTNAFIARYGGDEFCIICHCKSDRDAERIMMELQSEFDVFNQRHQCPYVLKCSIGYQRLQNVPDAIPQKLVHLADEMMYENKQRRREA